MSWKPIMLEEGTISWLSSLALEHGVDANTMLRVLIYTAQSPYNKSLIEHLVKMEKLAAKADTAPTVEEHDEAVKEMHQEIDKFVGRYHV